MLIWNIDVGPTKFRRSMPNGVKRASGVFGSIPPGPVAVSTTFDSTLVLMSQVKDRLTVSNIVGGVVAFGSNNRPTLKAVGARLTMSIVSAFASAGKNNI